MRFSKKDCQGTSPPSLESVQASARAPPRSRLLVVRKPWPYPRDLSRAASRLWPRSLAAAPGRGEAVCYGLLMFVVSDRSCNDIPI